MQVVEKLVRFSIAVNDMKKSKKFYADALGLEITEDYREDDDNWWVTLIFPAGDTVVSLGKAAKYGADEPLKPGMVALYMQTSDAEAALEELGKKGVKTSEIMDELFGPGSDTKFFTVEDPDGNSINIFQQM